MTGTRNRSEHGFTLVELVITCAVIPLIVAAIGLGLLEAFQQQGSVAGRLTDQGDAQIVSTDFEPDVQGALSITTLDQSAATPVPCGTGTSAAGTQLLGLVLGNGTEVSYVTRPDNSGTPGSDVLYRYVCSKSSTSTLISSSPISFDWPASQAAPTLTGSITATGSTTTTSTTSPTTVNSLATTGWIPVNGQLNGQYVTVTGVTWNISEGAVGNAYAYSLSAVPKASSYPAQSSGSGITGTTNCNFANPSTGTYASTLCFIDMTNFKTIQSVNNGQCTNSGANPDMNIASIPGTPYFMEFCITLTPAKELINNTASGCTGSNPGPSCYNASISAVPIPTYYDPPYSEAYLGNNGFYTGIQGNPALYETTEGSTLTTFGDPATVTIAFSGIQVVDGSGQAATGWSLVTGDAESTDAAESITWTSNAGSPLTLLPDTPSSAYGNACAYTTQSGGVWLTGLGTTSVECAANVNSDKTGTVMLQAQPPSSQTPMTLSVVLNGSGLQAMFLGLLLP